MIKQIALAATVAAITVYGVGSTSVTQAHCNADVTRYVTAHFEQDYICPDMDGNITTCTDYTTELASIIITTPTRDGAGRGKYTHDGYYFSDFPQISKRYEDNIYFEGYTQDEVVRITKWFSDGDYMMTSDHLACMLGTGTEQTYRTLYGVKLWLTN